MGLGCEGRVDKLTAHFPFPLAFERTAKICSRHRFARCFFNGWQQKMLKIVLVRCVGFKKLKPDAEPPLCVAAVCEDVAAVTSVIVPSILGINSCMSCWNDGRDRVV